MSIPTKEQATRFLAPLKGKATVVLLHDTRARMQLGRFMLGCAGLQRMATVVFDADAFYSSNIDRFAEETRSIPVGELLLLPEQDFEVPITAPTPLLEEGDGHNRRPELPVLSGL